MVAEVPQDLQQALLRGGGLSGFGVSWITGLLPGFVDSIKNAGDALVRTGALTPILGPLLWLLGQNVVMVGVTLSLILLPLVWVRDQIQAMRDHALGVGEPASD